MGSSGPIISTRGQGHALEGMVGGARVKCTRGATQYHLVVSVKYSYTSRCPWVGMGKFWQDNNGEVIVLGVEKGSQAGSRSV